VMTNRSELVTAARDGDRHAFADLVELESREAIGLCLAILRNQPDAEDAAQEAFVRAWRQLPSLRDPDLWGGWFRRLTVTAAIDYHRRRRNGNHVPLDGQEPPPLPDTQHALAARDEMRRLIARLDAKDQALLVLRFGHDLELPQVAEALGIPVGTAKSRLHRTPRSTTASSLRRSCTSRRVGHGVQANPRRLAAVLPAELRIPVSGRGERT
jgi:RNA polymerase sigma-70 factor (ECF subfamily)